MSKNSRDKLLDTLSTGVFTATELRRQLDVSQPTISRWIRRAGEKVIRLGDGRSTRYTAARDVAGQGSRVPIFAVDRAGMVDQVATLGGAANDVFIVEADEAYAWMLGESGQGWFESLPFFLYDLRPAGYLGRVFARYLAEPLDVPSDPRRWHDEHILRFLCTVRDLPGNLILSRQTAESVRASTATMLHEPHLDYSRMAAQVAESGIPGSSAAGEQPKFLAHCRDVGPVLVKFSPPGQSDESLRWKDLLRAEACALRAVDAQGISAAKVRVITDQDRTYLESQRFDRVGRLGRRPALSLAMVDAEFVGRINGWTTIARGLHERGMLGDRDLQTIEWLEFFGTWIANNDMHPGNLSLAPSGRSFGLLPVYDMLPMAFAPRRGELPEPLLRPPVRTLANRPAWESSRLAAVGFWTSVAEDRNVSDRFRRIAGQQARRCDETSS